MQNGKTTFSEADVERRRKKSVYPDGDAPDTEVVYLIHAPQVGLVKIGSTRDAPTKRMKSLQVGCPVELALVGVLEGGWFREQELHRQFADRRVRGEWFDDAILDEL